MQRKRRAMVGTSILVAVIGSMTWVGSAARAASAGDCVTGLIPVSFVLPDGSVHAPGTFTACVERDLTPTRVLHRISTAGSVRGFFVAETLSTESERDRPFLTFQRVSDREWILLGITLPATGRGEHAKTLRFADEARVARLMAGRNPVGEPVTLIASRR